MSRPVRFALLTFAGLVLLQAAWILALPPFRGIDEFEHVHRGAGVAAGQWRLTEGVDNGRGLAVKVPRDVVLAASPQCDALVYTQPGNCFPSKASTGADAVVATAAGAYNPLYYAAIGLPTRWLDGAAVDYGMRILSALVCAVGIATAAYALGVSRAGSWARFGFLASLTPVLVYTTVLPAPNSWEIVAGLCLWASLLSFFDRRTPEHLRVRMLILATVAAGLLSVLRTLGPLWLGLIVLCVVSFAGRDRVASVLLPRIVLSVLCSCLVLASVVVGAWWTLSAGLTDPSSELASSGWDGEWSFGQQPLVWVMQLVGAFPLRDQPAPLPVYAAYFLVVIALLAAALRVAKGRRRWTIAGAMTITLVMPMVLTALTVQSQGIVWQGRYQLAFVVGVLLMCGSALDERTQERRRNVIAPALGLSLLALCQAWSVVHVLLHELGRPVSVADESWVAAPPWLVAVLALSSMGLLSLATQQGPYMKPLDDGREAQALVVGAR